MNPNPPQKRPARPTDCLVTVRDSRLNVRRIRPVNHRGASPVVLLHHALGSIPQWGDFPSKLADHCEREVIVYERRGHGASSPPARQRTPDYLHQEALEDLPGLLDVLGIAQPVLLGHSDGGSIALLYAAFHRPEAVITLAAHVMVEAITLAGIRAACLQREQLLQRLRRYHGKQTETLFAAWAETWLDPGFQNWDITGLLPNIHSPVLAIQGLNDEYGTIEQVRRIEELVGGPCRTLLLENCGHEPQREQKVQVVAAVGRFLDDW